MDYIDKYIWNRKSNQNYLQSIKKTFNLKNIQVYFSIMSLYFPIHNTHNAKRLIDFQRHNYIKSINNYKPINDISLNGIVECETTNKQSKELFCKVLPILDPVNFMMNNYDSKNTGLSSNYEYNRISKINDMNNTSYIDVFFSYIVGELTTRKILPNFAVYYGSVNGIIDEFLYDVTDEIMDFEYKKWFNRNIGKRFDVEVKCDGDEITDIVAKLYDLPVQLLFIQKFDSTLEDLLKNDIDLNILESCLFQIIFCLAYLQKHFNFTHNDLHINNVMFVKTETLYLYYKFNNIYFKIPTFGYIFKIIDFGRSVFTYKNRIFHNDSFSKYGDAEGQYDYPDPSIKGFKRNKYNNEIKPNSSFDMCRLSITILDCLDEMEGDVVHFLNHMSTDCNGRNLHKEGDESFELYIDIARDSRNAIPHELLLNDIFKKYRIKKKMFPKTGYRLD